MRFIAFLLLAYIFLFSYQKYCVSGKTFIVDWENDRLLKDGQPFRYVAGSFHYFRAHPNSWQRKLRTMRAAGLNAVSTYVEWSLHNPKEGAYVWSGIADLERFLTLAALEDLFVILRPGPYICAERDFGGFPYWLLTKYPNIRLRTHDIQYLYEVRTWYRKLMPRITPFLYGNGGPIIMVQLENEYGSYFECDSNYLKWLTNLTTRNVDNKAVLFTTDGPQENYIACGSIPGVLATIDFGAGATNLTQTFKYLRKIQPKGPLINSEYYPGWLTHWTEKTQRVDTEPIIQTLIQMLDLNVNVNFYMFFGGTNFGFTAGANDGGIGKYQPDITSYDYDAPMDEAGTPTEKYYKLREVIGRYLPLPNITIPDPIPKKNYGTIRLLSCPSILSESGRKWLSTGTDISEEPKTFEALNQYSGLVLYETFLPTFKNDPSILRVTGLHDRAFVYIDGYLVGLLSRNVLAYEIPISASAGSRLQILVENQGRINYGSITDFKGITKDVVLGNEVLENWNMTKYPFESYEDIENFIKDEDAQRQLGFRELRANTMLYNGPTVYYGVLNIDDNQVPGDTYLDFKGWGKGILFVNGENLGRYWPVVGPQITLYIPNEILRKGANKIVVIEYQRAAPALEVTFRDEPIFNN